MTMRELVESKIIQWREVRKVRLEAEKVAQKLLSQEADIKSFLIENFREEKLEGMIIDGRSTGLSARLVPAVRDKEALLEHIKATGELDLLQFRLAGKAVDARREGGVEVPGTEYVEVFDLFDRKV